jgi:CubicO group peptidase (beta-lactamase class C family)
VNLSVLLCSLIPVGASAQTIAKARPEDVGMSSQRLDRLTSTLDAYVTDGRLSGGVALVLRHGKVAYLHSFGERDIASHAAMNDSVIFRIASQTKAIISVGVMILQEQGKLLIGDAAGKYIPELAKTTVAVPKAGGGYDVVDAKRPITIRDLLTHTSGVSYGNGPAADRWKAAGITGWYFADRAEPIQATVGSMAALPFDAQPGERWIYGYSTDILGALIERVSGMPLDEFVRTNITGPLRMTDTQFYLDPAKTTRLATVYSATRDGGLQPAPDPGAMAGQGAYVTGPRKSFSGGAGLLSTARDYARFLQMLLNGGELDGVRVLSPTTVKLMTVDHAGDRYGDAGMGFGLGFAVVEDMGERGVPGSVGEFSWGGAYHSTYWVDPGEDMVVVYFTQVIPAGSIDDHAKLRALIYQAIIDG